jgi:hypothetical protein
MPRSTATNAPIRLAESSKGLSAHEGQRPPDLVLENDDHAQGKATQDIVANAREHIVMKEMGEPQKDQHENTDAHQHLRTARATDKAQDTIDAEIQNHNLYCIGEPDL